MSDAILNTRFGEITIIEQKGWGYSGETVVTVKLGDMSVEAISTRQADDAEVEPPSFNMRSRPMYMGADCSRQLAALLAFCAELGDLLSEADADRLKAQEEREAEEERLEAKRREEEEAQTKGREQILLMELMGERVKVRHAGYKSATEAIVGATEDHRPGHEGEYQVQLQQYGNHEGMYSRGRRNVEAWRRLDVKTTKGWRTVWDDGKDDLPSYDRGKDAPQYQPYK